jgi:hypothetical protein
MSIQQSINQTLSLWSLVSPYAEGKRTEKRIEAEEASRQRKHEAKLDTLKEKFDVATTRVEHLPIKKEEGTDGPKGSVSTREDAILARKNAIKAGEAYLGEMTSKDISPEGIASFSDRLEAMREDLKSAEKYHAEREKKRLADAKRKAKKQEEAEMAARLDLETEQGRQAFWNQITENMYVNPEYKNKKGDK